MVKVKKSAFLFFIVALMVLLVSACGNSDKTAKDSPSAPAATDAPKNTEAPVNESVAPDSVMTKQADGKQITAWGWDKPEFNKPIEDYILESAGVKVNGVTMTASDVLTKITASAAAGSGLPDVFKATSTQIPQLVELNAVMDITDMVAPYKDLLPQAAWDMVTFNDKIWGIPANSPAAGMFYRNDVLQKYGIDPATITTWDNFIEAGKKLLKDSGGKVHLFNSSKNSLNNYIFQTIIQQYRAELVSNDKKVVVSPDSEAWQKALELSKKIIDAGVMIEMDDWSQPWYQAIKDGSVAAFPSGTWFSQIILQQAPDTKGLWYFTPVPAVEEGGDRYPNYGSATVFISSQTKNKEAGFEWVKAWSIDPHGAIEIGLEQLGISVIANAALDNAYVNSPHEYFANGQKYWRDATEAFFNNKYIPPSTIWANEVNATFNRDMALFLSGKQSSKDVLATLQKDITKIAQ